MICNTNFTLINDSDADIGPLNLPEIFEGCDAEPQIVKLAPGEHVAFSGCGDQPDVIKMRLHKLGIKLGKGGLIVDTKSIIVIEPKTISEPVDIEPPGPDL